MGITIAQQWKGHTTEIGLHPINSIILTTTEPFIQDDIVPLAKKNLKQNDKDKNDPVNPKKNNDVIVA